MAGGPDAAGVDWQKSPVPHGLALLDEPGIPARSTAASPEMTSRCSPWRRERRGRRSEDASSLPR